MTVVDRIAVCQRTMTLTPLVAGTERNHEQRAGGGSMNLPSALPGEPELQANCATEADRPDTVTTSSGGVTTNRSVLRLMYMMFAHLAE